MTDSAGTPAGPDSPDSPDSSDSPDPSSGPDTGTPGAPPAGPAKRKRHWLRWTALGVAVVLLAGAGVGWSLYRKLDGNIKTDTSTANELEKYEAERPHTAPVARDAENILLIGSDTRSGKGNRKYGQDGGTQRSDTTILLHLAADRKSATAVSLPRDLMAEIPSCEKKDGTRTQEQYAQFNWAFEFAGPACTIRTVEKLTGIRVDHHMIVDFKGFKKIVDAVDGVDVCLKEPIDDSEAHLQLPAGAQKLNGEQALGYVRVRYSIGNGSDTERMGRQQQFLGALVEKMQSSGVLLNPAKLYPVLDAATSSLTTDPGLSSLRDLYNLVRGMRDIPTDKVQFMTVPRQSYRYDANRDELVQPDASRLFKRLRNDRPVSVIAALAKDGESKKGTSDSKDGGRGDNKPDESSSPTPSTAPTFQGSTAARSKC